MENRRWRANNSWGCGCRRDTRRRGLAIVPVINKVSAQLAATLPTDAPVQCLGEMLTVQAQHGAPSV